MYYNYFCQKKQGGIKMGRAPLLICSCAPPRMGISSYIYYLYLSLLIKIKLHRIRRISDLLELIHRHKTCRCTKNCRDSVDNRRTGMLYGCRFHNVELSIRLACDLPVTHISIIRSGSLTPLSSKNTL